MSLPVTVLTGFLGAGKTTLVNRLLKELPGTRFGLIVNEFGEAALETQLVENRKRPIHELPSGCLCCVNDGDLKAALEALTHRDRKIDHILVEASGLSSPGPMLGVLAGDGPYRLSGVFCLVDTTSFLAHEKDFPTLRKQLNFADAVFLTKTDLASPDQVAAVETRLGSLKPGARVLPTSGRLPWSALFDAEAAPKAAETVEAGAGRRRFFQGGKHHDAEVFEYSDPTPLDPVKLGQVFAALPAGVLRAKGVVNLADRSAQKHKYIVQYTGAQKQLYSRPWARDERRQTDLLFIGTGLDAAGLRRDLDACRVGAP